MSGLTFTKSAFLKAAKKDDAWYHKDGFEPGAEAFLKSYYDDTEQNDALDLPLEDILALARSFWMSGDRRKVGQSSIRVEPITDVSALANKYDVVEIITDDRTFLVDSVIGEISSHGIDILALYHPIIEGYRNEEGLWRKKGTKVRESMIQVIIPHQSLINRKAIREGLIKTLDDLDKIVSDFEPMLGVLETEIERLYSRHGDVPKDVLDESIAFLEWLKDGNFVLLGTRTYKYEKISGKAGGQAYNYVSPKMVKSSCLGVLRDTKRMILRQSSEPAQIAQNLQTALLDKDPVTVAKSNLFSRVHRRVRMDYISIKHYGEDGQVNGETRIAGLFTVDAYARSPKYVPLIRRKVERVMQRYGAEPNTHNAKRLEFVLSSYPRDELFQSSEDDLFRIATGIAQAYDRPRTRMFVRKDPFRRFVSVLVFVPRENYNTTVRKRIGACLKAAWNGRVSAFYPQYSDSPLARVHFIIGLDPDTQKSPNLEELEKEIARLSQPWSAGLLARAEETQSSELIAALPEFQNAFPPAYQLAFPAEVAVADIESMLTLDEDNPLAVRVYFEEDDVQTIMRVKFFRAGQRLELSDVMPIFNNMGLHVAQETGYAIKTPKRGTIWMHDYEMHLSHNPQDRQALAGIFAESFLAVWQGRNEDDGFNALILPQSVGWRRVAVLRLLARYRKQAGLDPSEAVQIEALAKYPEITGLMLDLFEVKFDPALNLSLKARKEKVEAIEARLSDMLESVTSLDHDRVLRRMISVLSAMLRTNFFITDTQGNPHPFISVKINTRALSALPEPKPYREIFVWSARMEGLHLRNGPVARGGIRWSDRRDDFRTEILGLVKAQQVKNAVIVPVGSKGGFYPKKLPVGGSRDEVMAEGIAAYTELISGLLDITDSYKGRNTVQPQNVVCWDDPDPYLVVAADKGTASFSDIANGIAANYDFWLGDAFASGGSVGYDHKAMGITARGAWEAVKRHFREMGKDIQNEDFDVIGVGDMSGDVFGNGMLLSRHIRLKAAFDHRDIFIDPDPDPKTSFKERQRLFKLPRSSWQDYNTKLISKGGGVFSRAAKSIALSPEIRKMTGLSEETVTPNQLIKALLKSETELLWFGGIGTYIKASDESQEDAHDKANNPIRVNGAELKTKVVGEGANLGATQAGRIEFARHGGRINTDAIDNSAGVDCSDNEVNIKILLAGAIEAGELKADGRVALLESMTDDVARLVLRHNYDQTGALSLAEKYALRDHHAYARFMDDLEAQGRLDRAVEGLPSASDMLRMADKKQALTRPELAVLNAYAKTALFDDLITSDLAEDPYFDQTLQAYFPPATHGFGKALKSHRLRREIIISRLANRIVDVGGPVFVSRLSEQTNADMAEIAKAFTIAYEVLEIDRMRAAINALDNIIRADAQLAMHDEIAVVLQRVINWLVRRNEKGSIEARIARRTAGLKNVDESWIKVLSTYDSHRVAARIGHFIRDNVPEALAADVSLLRARASGFDVVELSDRTGWPIRRSAELFYAIGGRFKIDRLRTMSMQTTPTTHWEALAQQRIEEDFYAAQAALALEAANLHIKSKASPNVHIRTIVKAYTDKKHQAVQAYEQAYTKLNASGGWTLAKFALINAQLRELLSV